MPRLPNFLTVEEAADILRIGRTAAYALTRRWRDTNGQEGLPVVTLGRLLRVPRAELERLSGGPLSTEPAGTRRDQPASPTPDDQPRSDVDRTPPPRRRRSRLEQDGLPFDE